MRTKSNGLFVLVAMVVDYSTIGKIGLKNELFTKKRICHISSLCDLCITFEKHYIDSNFVHVVTAFLPAY